MLGRRAVAGLVIGSVMAGWAAAGVVGEPAGFQQARQFWKTVVKADAEKLKDSYAPEVLVKAGSTLLGADDRLGRGSPNEDHRVGREDLVQAYRRMVDGFGKSAWKDVFERIGPEQVKIGMSSRAGDPFEGALPGDVVLRVIVYGQEKLIFVLRPDSQGRWVVVAESTKY